MVEPHNGILFSHQNHIFEELNLEVFIRLNEKKGDLQMALYTKMPSICAYITLQKKGHKNLP